MATAAGSTPRAGARAAISSRTAASREPGGAGPYLINFGNCYLRPGIIADQIAALPSTRR